MSLRSRLARLEDQVKARETPPGRADLDGLVEFWTESVWSGLLATNADGRIVLTSAGEAVQDEHTRTRLLLATLDYSQRGQHDA